MKIYKATDYEQLSKKAASLIAAQMIAKPDSVLGLATGSTPVGIYGMLVKWYEAGLLDFSKIKTFNLDEYRGMAKDNIHGYYYFMKHNLFSKINIPEESTYIQDALETDAEKAGSDYECLIQSAGGIDLQLLGLGHNGHIGFNEPGEVFTQDCYCVNLAEETINANQRFFSRKEDVPKQAYTMGIGTIMRASKILLVVSGREKAEILRKALEEPVTPHVPASILQFHNDVTVVGDEAALSALKCSDVCIV